MRVYITKYALTQGILVKKVRDCGNGMVEVPTECCRCYHRPNWWTTPEEALARAKIMRTKKIASLRKQLAKLEAMTFQVPNE